MGGGAPDVAFGSIRRSSREGPWAAAPPWPIVLYVCLLALAVRLPFFFRIGLDWDEATYILVGQSLLDGHLPYTETWEIKPPLGFFAYALFIAMLGKSVVAVRAGGALCVAVAGIFVFVAGRAAGGTRAGVLGATSFVLLASLVQAGQATMTEHVALVPLCAAFAVATLYEPSLRVALVMGVLLGLASMVRLNLAYVAAVVGLWVVASSGASMEGRWRRGAAYVLGGGCVVIASLLPYVFTGQTDLWWSAVVLAPLSYVRTQNSAVENVLQLTQRVAGGDSPWSALSLTTLIWPLAALGIVLAAARFRRQDRQRRHAVIAVGVFLVAAVLSVLRSGAAREHYLLQVFPMISVAAAIGVDLLLATRARIAAAVLLLASLWISVRPVVRGYEHMIGRIADDRPLIDEPITRVGDYLERHHASDAPMYLMVDHILYWLLDAKPISRITHPSNISREALLPFIVGPGATSEREMAVILARHPRYIVTREDLWYLRRARRARELLERELREHYVLAREIGDRRIYRRKTG